MRMPTQPWIHSPNNISASPRSSERHKRLRPSDVLVRAATAELLRQNVGQDLFEDVALSIARHYDGCVATDFYTRAAVNPAASTTAGWAAELVGTAIIDFITTDMARSSGFAQLAQRALTVPLEQGVGVIKIPARASPLALMGSWIGEGNAKPLFAAVFNTTTLQSYKLSAISTFTEAMMAASAIEQIVRESLAHDLTALLDTACFDATAASSLRPAGLFNGATTVTKSPASPLTDAMFADLGALTAAVSASNADASVAFVANPAQALRLRAANVDAIISGYMPAGSVGAIDTAGVAMIVGQPVFQVTDSAALHMDSAAGPLSTVGSPNVVSAPLRSLFQEDLVGLRCVLRAGWVKRRAAATALVTGVAW
jgi:capsid protein